MPLRERADPAIPPLVLIVDSDARTRSVYVEHLRRAGWNTEQAEDGPDALAKAIGHPPAVVVTDTRLAFIDGYELCRLLRRDTDTAAVPIIVLAAANDPEHVMQARQAGAEAVLVKPCGPESLESEINRVVGNGAGGPGDDGAPGHQSPTRGRRDRPFEPAAPSAAGPPVRRSLVRMHYRHETKAPALTPPDILCPSCSRPLSYERSHIGGVSEHHSEQWDDFMCSVCGPFQYRHRTRKLRRT